jgi:peptidoglycan hydrolase-like protein with peptidoglycan-binding domain
VIDAIGAVIHTNAASVESSLQSSKNWGNRGIYNTKPHYNFNGTRPEKNVPTNRRAIANSTGSSVEDEYGCPDSSFWLLAFETADRGYNASPPSPEGGPDLGPFLYDHDELIARALAYEAIACNFSLVIPTEFYTPGVYTHTKPWPYPYLTIRRGKTCPTITKKDQILNESSEIMARARELYTAWSGVTPPVMPPGIPFDPANGEYGLWPLNPSKPTLQIGSQGDAVKYLQGGLKNEIDPGVVVDGDFGPQTLTAVTEFQNLFNLPVHYASFDDDDWDVFDQLVTGAIDVPVDPPAPSPSPDYISVGTGRYYRLPGEWAWRVSYNVYGDGSHAEELAALNPGTWKPGQIIKCPDVIGRTMQVPPSGTILGVLRVMFPADNPYDHLQDFFFWNGGEDRVLHEGEWVSCSINWEDPHA